MVKVNAEKSGCPPMAPMIGVMMFSTRDVTMAPNAAPITTAIARSRTLPRRMKVLNSSTRPLISNSFPELADLTFGDAAGTFTSCHERAPRETPKTGCGHWGGCDRLGEG